MKTVEEHGYDNPTVEMTVYTNHFMFAKAGRTAEEVAVEYLSGAFDMAQVNYVIHYDLPVIALPERETPCGEQFDMWNQRIMENDNMPLIAKDSNVLLVDGMGGGCANNPDISPGHCAVGTTTWTEFREYDLHQPIDSGHNFWVPVNALLHEVGHNLGFRHNPSGGWGYVDDDGRHHRTPNSSHGAENFCGEWAAEPVSDDDVRYAFWHWCTVRHMDIVDAPIGTDGASLPEDPPTVNPTPPDPYPPVLDGKHVHNEDEWPTPPSPIGDLYWDPLDVSGGEEEVTFDWRIANLNAFDVRAYVTFTTPWDEEQYDIVVPPNDGVTLWQETTLDAPVDEESEVEACATITNAEYA